MIYLATHGVSIAQCQPSEENKFVITLVNPTKNDLQFSLFYAKARVIEAVLAGKKKRVPHCDNNNGVIRGIGMVTSKAPILDTVFNMMRSKKSGSVNISPVFSIDSQGKKRNTLRAKFHFEDYDKHNVSTDQCEPNKENKFVIILVNNTKYDLRFSLLYDRVQVLETIPAGKERRVPYCNNKGIIKNLVSVGPVDTSGGLLISHTANTFKTTFEEMRRNKSGIVVLTAEWGIKRASVTGKHTQLP